MAGPFDFRPLDVQKLSELFHTDDLDTIVYREVVDHVAPDGLKDGDTFDLRVATTPRGFLYSDNMQIGVCYFPNGPTLKGIQAVRAGATLVFPKLPFKSGAELVVAMDGTDAVSVDLYAKGAAPKAEPPPPAPDPVANTAKSIAPWAVGALALYFVIHELAKKL